MNTEHDESVSKSERKRGRASLRKIAEQLINLSKAGNERLKNQLQNTKLMEALQEARKITKPDARKRTVQHIAKLLDRLDDDEKQFIYSLADHTDDVSKSRKLEVWREGLLQDMSKTMAVIISECPDLDRRSLRQLVQKAKKELEDGNEESLYFKKLYQFLKNLNLDQPDQKI
ncbi:MAG: DUF615 domain-containing protein [Gammaproteobacteria bacterium]|nr:DUF615 domain-containing protein [Gammaproteobacteria bacterium]